MSRFVRDSVWVGASTAVSMASNILGQPILNYFLGPAGRGVLAFVQVVSAMVFDMVRLGAGQANSYYVAKGESFWQVVIADTIYSAIACVASWTVLAGLALWTGHGHPSMGITWAIALAGMLTPLARIGNAVCNALIGASQFAQFSQCAMAGAVAFLAARLLFVPWLGVPGAILADGISLVAATALALRMALMRYVRFEWPSPDLVKRLFVYSLSGGPAVLAAIAIQRASIFILFVRAGANVTGLYAAALALIVPLYTLPSIMGNLVQPRSATMTTETAIDQIGLVSRLVLLVSVAGTVVLASSARWLLLLFGGRDFTPVAGAFQVVVLCVPLRSLAQVVFSHFSGAGRPGLQSIAASIAGGVTILLCLILIPHLGATGAAIADLSGALVLAALAVYWFARLRHTTPLTLVAPRRSDVARLLTGVRPLFNPIFGPRDIAP